MNYQITSEVATRAVIQVSGADGDAQNPRIQVESFNVLPPD